MNNNQHKTDDIDQALDMLADVGFRLAGLRNVFRRVCNAQLADELNLMHSKVFDASALVANTFEKNPERDPSIVGERDE